jgi:hypothetical protein
LRQGNENKEVEIFNYVTESTLDSYLYSTVTNKARFIAQILDDESPARVSEDMDEKVLTYAEIQAVASGNPDIKERIETENTLAELNMLKREWGSEKARMRECLETYPAMLEKSQALLTKIQADMPNAKTVVAMKELPFSNERIHAEINRAVANYKNGKREDISIGTVDGFAVSVKAVEIGKGCLLDKYKSGIDVKITIKGESEYSFEPGRGENDNNVVRLKNVFLNIIPKREEKVANDIKHLSENIEQAQIQIDVPFEYEEKIVELEKRFEELNSKLSGITKQEDVIGDPDDAELSDVDVLCADDNDYQAVENDECDDTPDTPNPPQKGQNGRSR